MSRNADFTFPTLFSSRFFFLFLENGRLADPSCPPSCREIHICCANLQGSEKIEKEKKKVHASCVHVCISLGIHTIKMKREKKQTKKTKALQAEVMEKKKMRRGEVRSGELGKLPPITTGKVRRTGPVYVVAYPELP